MAVGAHDVQIGEPAPGELGGGCGVGVFRLGIGRTARPAHGRQAHADAACGQYFGHCGDHFVQQAQTIFEAPAVLVLTPVGAAAQELVDQVSVRRVHLHTVEPRARRAARRMAVIIKQAGNFIQVERARLGEGHGRPFAQPVADEGLALGRPHAGGYRRAAFGLEHLMTDRADMPQLAEDPPTGIMHRVGHQLPAFHLAVGENPRCPGIALPFVADLRGLGNDKARARPLRIIKRVERGLLAVARRRAAAGKRGHPHPVGRGDIRHIERVEQRCVGIGHGKLRNSWCRAEFRGCSPLTTRARSRAFRRSAVGAEEDCGPKNLQCWISPNMRQQRRRVSRTIPKRMACGRQCRTCRSRSLRSGARD